MLHTQTCTVKRGIQIDIAESGRVSVEERGVELIDLL